MLRSLVGSEMCIRDSLEDDDLAHSLKAIEFSVRHHFCEPLRCQNAGMVEEPAKGWATLITILSAILLLGSAVFYVVLWLNHTSGSQSTVLRRRSAVSKPKSRFAKFVHDWFKHKPKSY
eukprot:TRINITY_DN5246_c0_g1_i1.p1 TRINITY_DN5246_c0_g1~~TRINITY_DN5246_c0_g1_i1.p1  ORF type:complete len:119 (-),score=25.95 TRINITY_DN5246_c0_g1_i1:27-383(-)